ncbi:unnamed protein product [Caenorhabditis angaria]|uniref:Uncharacterized protein n=1 Tax=Caenorhabditis angaria TaxID=860376 RepID=A0A9P1N7C1_9PELO|nr:unnamed protein product [Caenorhabditis angaria]
MPLVTRHSLSQSERELSEAIDELSEVELRFSKLSDDEKDIEEEEDDIPRDRFNFVFFIFFYFGSSSLISWNMFVSVSFDYYETFKLEYNKTSTWYSQNFQNAMTISSQTPDWLFCVFGLFLDLRGNLPRRMQLSIFVSVLTLLATMSLIYVDTSTWLLVFFIFTLVTIVVLNSAIGVFDNSLFGLVGTFPVKYTLAVVTGQNFNGIFVTVLSILSKTASDNVQISSMVFFGIAVIFKLGCMFLLRIMQRNAFYQHFGELKNEAENKENEKIDEISDFESLSIWHKFFEAFKKAKCQFLNIFILMFVTFSVFPNVTIYIRDEELGQPYTFFVPEKYYIDIVTLLNFNFFSFFGSLLANTVHWPGPGYIWLPVWLRIWYIFYFPLCNYQPEERKIDVIFKSTWLFISNQASMAFTCGYLSSLIMTYAPKTSDKPELQRLIGMMAYICLLTGCILGLIFSWVIKIIVLH